MRTCVAPVGRHINVVEVFPPAIGMVVLAAGHHDQPVLAQLGVDVVARRERSALRHQHPGRSIVRAHPHVIGVTAAPDPRPEHEHLAARSAAQGHGQHEGADPRAPRRCGGAALPVPAAVSGAPHIVEGAAFSARPSGHEEEVTLAVGHGSRLIAQRGEDGGGGGDLVGPALAVRRHVDGVEAVVGVRAAADAVDVGRGVDSEPAVRGARERPLIPRNRRTSSAGYTGYQLPVRSVVRAQPHCTVHTNRQWLTSALRRTTLA